MIRLQSFNANSVSPAPQWQALWRFPYLDKPMTRQQTMEAVARLAEYDIDEDDELAISGDVVASFGDVQNDTSAHVRAVKVLHSCLARYLWTWASLGCELPGPLPAADAVKGWLSERADVDDLAVHTGPVVPLRNGQPVQDCDEPALSNLSNAAASLVRFCITRQSSEGAEVLYNLFWADAEGLQADDAVDLIGWLASVGMETAWKDS